MSVIEALAVVLLVLAAYFLGLLTHAWLHGEGR